MKFSLIAAVDKNYGIGKDGKMPWHIPQDLEYFSKITTGKGKNAVIMGRTTWESLPKKHRPLLKRLNIVLSSNKNPELPPKVSSATSLNEALTIAEKNSVDEIFVIGGAKVFSQTINHELCNKIYLTEIDEEFECDTFFPLFNKETFEQKNRSENYRNKSHTYNFVIYEKK